MVLLAACAGKPLVSCLLYFRFQRMLAIDWTMSVCYLVQGDVNSTPLLSKYEHDQFWVIVIYIHLVDPAFEFAHLLLVLSLLMEY